MSRRIIIFMLLVLPVFGGILGRGGAPVLARTHRTVRLADQLRMEEASPLAASTLESDAFRDSGRTNDELYKEAALIESQFAVGSMLLGVWCALVIAMKYFGLYRTRRREIYEINYDACVACLRCYRSCPRDRGRIEKRLADAAGE